MKSFIIMEGGGIKGCALAGALAAAEDMGIQPIGYGGSSAGAIIATLAAAHYTGEEIGQELIKMEFIRLLDGKGSDLKNYSVAFKKLSNVNIPPISRLKLMYISFKLQPHIKKYWSSLGIYEGSAFLSEIEKLVQNKIPTFSKKTTFKQFEELEGCPLRIVASNITMKKPIIFSSKNTPNHSVLDALRSSACYPFLYQPVILNDQHHIDGGMSSNLPCFLFSSEYSNYGIPSILFNLCQLSVTPKLATNIIDYFKDLFATALESSDHILRSIGIGTIAVEVEVPNDINTLDFFLKKEDRDRLYDKGYQSTSKNLKNIPRIKTMRNAGSEQNRQLIAMYGTSQIYQTILKTIADNINSQSKAINIRACIFLPTDRNSLMNVYNVGFRNSSDKYLELNRGEGAVWGAWLTQKVIFCDLTLSDDQYLLRNENQNLIENDRKSLISVHIPSTLSTTNISNQPLGVLGIDSSTKLQDTGWMDDNSSDIYDILTTWIPIIQRLIRANLIYDDTR